MKIALKNRKHIKLLVTKFYDCLLNDKELEHFFKHIIDKDELESHLEVITDFWQDILFGTLNYGKNAMKPHFELNKKIPFKEQHFKLWLNHFIYTVDSLYSGEKAELAKQRAQSIATIMQIKLSNH